MTVAFACSAEVTTLTVMPLSEYYESSNAYVFNHYNTEPTFCGTFSQAMVENYNHGATGGYRGPLLAKLQAAGIATTYVGHVHSGTA